MHSSPLLDSKQFTVRVGANGGVLRDVFPDYHPQDRVAVVSRVWEDAFSGAAVAVTALTTLFYEAQRAAGKPFFIYPAHYLFINESLDRVITRAGDKRFSEEFAEAWTNLDVWPGTQWMGVRSNPRDILEAVFAQHINRLFLPEELDSAGTGAPLPTYVRDTLITRLKGIYIYDSEAPDIRLEASGHAGRLVEKSAGSLASEVADPTTGACRRIAVEDFLKQHEDCFEPGKSLLLSVA